MKSGIAAACQGARAATQAFDHPRSTIIVHQPVHQFEELRSPEPEFHLASTRITRTIMEYAAGMCE
jgi:hypothetical protein